MDSYRTYRHLIDTARVRIARILWSWRAYRHEYCIVHSGNCVRLVRKRGKGTAAVRMPVGKYVSPAPNCHEWLIRRENVMCMVRYGSGIFSFGSCAPFIAKRGLVSQPHKFWPILHEYVMMREYFRKLRQLIRRENVKLCLWFGVFFIRTVRPIRRDVHGAWLDSP